MTQHFFSTIRCDGQGAVLVYIHLFVIQHDQHHRSIAGSAPFHKPVRGGGGRGRAYSRFYGMYFYMKSDDEVGEGTYSKIV